MLLIRGPTCNTFPLQVLDISYKQKKTNAYCVQFSTLKCCLRSRNLIAKCNSLLMHYSVITFLIRPVPTTEYELNEGYTLHLTAT
jgi:hypothetical protein